MNLEDELLEEIYIQKISQKEEWEVKKLFIFQTLSFK